MSRTKQKLEIFKEMLLKVADLSVSSTKKVGCMALRKDFSKIASFGYNGSYAGAEINPETGTEEESLEPGKSGFIHAEINMIAKFKENDPDNYIILLTLSPCDMCTKVLVNAGFKHVYWIENYRELSHLKIFNRSGVTCGDFDNLLSDYERSFQRFR
jgi:dCMP deaminase